MFFFLPYRAKNPPERVPYVTWALIAINVLIFCLTSEKLLVIRPEMVDQFAVTHNNMTLGRMLSAIFLHGSIFHLAGNMLFLYLFGVSVEGRLGHLKYLLLYLITGYAGGFLQDLVTGLLSPDTPSLGASGAVMGMAGAYLYLFPYATICVFFAWGFFYRWGVTILEWPAWGVIAYYLGFDVLEGVLFQGADGVGHFAHIGGALAGFLGVLLLRAQRDTAEYSDAQTMRTDLGDNYDLMGVQELEMLMQGAALNAAMVTAYVRKTVGDYSGNTSFSSRGIAAMHQHARLLCEQGDAVVLAQTILSISEPSEPLPPILLLRLASKLETTQNYGLVIPLLQRLYRQAPNGPDAEMALLRLARISERGPDKRQAIAQYQEILRLFPNSKQSLIIEDTIRRLRSM